MRPKSSWIDDSGNDSIMLLPLVVLILILVLTMGSNADEFKLKITNESDSYVRVYVWFDEVEVIDVNLAPKGTEYYDIMDSSEKYTFTDYNGVVITTKYTLSQITFSVPGTWGNGMELEIHYQEGGYITIEAD